MLYPHAKFGSDLPPHGGERGKMGVFCLFVCLFLFFLLGLVILGAQRPIVVKLSRERSVGRSVGLSVCPVHCGKTADRHQTWRVDRACPYHFWAHLDILCPTSSFGARGLRKFGRKMTHRNFVPANLSFMNQIAPNFNTLRRQVTRI